MRTLPILLGLLTPSVALAHMELTYPPSRNPAAQKSQVCGAVGSVRGANPTVLAPGSTITVRWTETVEHPGHYRISFDANGQAFSIPPTATADTQLTDPKVIDDLIPDVVGPLPAGGRLYTQQITLPNIECTNCTLQVTQLMTDTPPYTTDAASNDIYYQCADITLRAGATPPPGPGPAPDPVPTGEDDEPAETTGGCTTGGAAGGGAAALALLGLVTRLRRRR